MEKKIIVYDREFIRSVMFAMSFIIGAARQEVIESYEVDPVSNEEEAAAFVACITSFNLIQKIFNDIVLKENNLDFIIKMASESMKKGIDVKEHLLKTYERYGQSPYNSEGSLEFPNVAGVEFNLNENGFHIKKSNIQCGVDTGSGKDHTYSTRYYCKKTENDCSAKCTFKMFTGKTCIEAGMPQIDCEYIGVSAGMH